MKVKEWNSQLSWALFSNYLIHVKYLRYLYGILLTRNRSALWPSQNRSNLWPNVYYNTKFCSHSKYDEANNIPITGTYILFKYNLIKLTIQTTWYSAVTAWLLGDSYDADDDDVSTTTTTVRYFVACYCSLRFVRRDRWFWLG